MAKNPASGTPVTWLVTAFGDDRQYAGNTGYQDDLDRAYRYDSKVPNHLRIKAGDLLVLRSKTHTLGVARIVEIDQRPGMKPQQLCPDCGKTGLKPRKVLRPLYRCHGCGATFDRPVSKEVPVTEYAARYAGAYETVGIKAAARDFRAACPRYNGQISMQVVVLEKLGVLGRPLRQAAARLLASVPREPTADPEELSRRVAALRALGPASRPAGCTAPRRIVTGQRHGYERDPAVVLWTLERAKGSCEACGSAGPFVDATGLPFLEVHHIHHLANGGPDVVENTVGLCPNCHRAMHLAPDKQARKIHLLEIAAARQA